MRNLPKVSIIVPVCNAATTVGSCIQSIVEQDYPSLECILVINGSTDSSVEVCCRYSEIYQSIKVAISTDVGVSHARNLGLSMATGDIIGFCDADDFLEQDAVKTVVSVFLKNRDIIGVIGAFYVGYEKKSTIQKQFRGKKSKKLSPEEAIALTIGDDNVMGSVWNKYYSAGALDKIVFDPVLSYCEDMHFNVKILSALKDERIMLISSPLYCYMQNNQSATYQYHNLFDKNGELKYIVALKKILNDCNLSHKCQSIAKAKIAMLAIDFLCIGRCNSQQWSMLKRELRENFSHFAKNFARFSLLSNTKRIVRLFFALLEKTIKSQ